MRKARKISYYVFTVIAVLIIAIGGFYFYQNFQNTSEIEVENRSVTSIEYLPEEAIEEGKIYADVSGKELTDLFYNSGIKLGFIHSQRFTDFNQGFPIRAYSESEEVSEYPNWQPVPLSDLIEPVSEPQDRGQLLWEKFKIDAPIIYPPFSDVFETKNDGTIDLGQAKDTSEINSPIQQRLREGVVHLPYSPLPGEMGNSYLLGHSSNFTNVESDYNFVFSELINNAQIGEEFIIIDHRGRELKFRVFETLEVAENDFKTAFGDFRDKRIVTLQGSILENGIPTKRYLVRGELIQ